MGFWSKLEAQTLPMSRMQLSAQTSRACCVSQIQTGVFTEMLAFLGAEMRWTSCSIFSTQNHAAAAVAMAGTSTVFAWKGKTLPDYWLVHRANDVRS